MDKTIIQLLRHLAISIMPYNIQFAAKHIPGKLNSAADALSHFQDLTQVAPWLNASPDQIPLLHPRFTRTEFTQALCQVYTPFTGICRVCGGFCHLVPSTSLTHLYVHCAPIGRRPLSQQFRQRFQQFHSSTNCFVSLTQQLISLSAAQ